LAATLNSNYAIELFF